MLLTPPAGTKQFSRRINQTPTGREAPGLKQQPVVKRDHNVVMHAQSHSNVACPTSQAAHAHLTTLVATNNNASSYLLRHRRGTLRRWGQ
jgi:hypothetical protein